jgi:hypothetical protein
MLLSTRRRSRPFAAIAVFALSGACSVYSSGLLDDASESTITGGKSGSVAGHGGTAGVVLGGNGGKSGTVVPTNGGEGEGGDPGNGSGAGSGGLPSSSGGSTGAGATAAVGGAGSGTGGSAGGPGTAGSGTAGSAGSPPVGAGVLVDGFEDQDLTLEQAGGGVWYLFDDGTVGTAGPAPLVCSPLSGAPAGLGGYAMHITATGFTGFGSGLGVDFRAGKKVFDASKFTGIRFWAKVGAGKNTRHRVQIADATTDKAGGKCNAAADAPNGEKCDDHFGFNATFTTSWAEYVISFEQLTQIGWGNPALALDKAALYGLQVTAKPKLEVDLWLDQIEFF